MQETLKRITELYIEHIPTTLQKCPGNLTLYAGFIPFLGWEAYPEDQCVHGRAIYILDTNELGKISSSESDPDEVSRRAYGWGEFIGGRSLTIESDELNDLLLQWYTYQIEQDESAELLDQIGSSVASACRYLNERGWNGRQFTEDFVVFTDCCADARCSIGIPNSMPEAWLQEKKSKGMFQWLR